jgi:uncharacterized glyoxalase superfamily protein PhnB
MPGTEPDGQTPNLASRMAGLASSVSKCVAMIYVPDVARALDWYASIGFTEIDRVAEDGLVNWGLVAFGDAEVMLNTDGQPGRQTASLWFRTTQVDEIYELLKARQSETAPGIVFEQDIENMFYGARQFCIRDPHGYELYFIGRIPA